MDGKTKILVVEDCLVQAKKTRHLLESAGYAVTLAAHGKEALEKLPECRPALILTDIVMPEMNGYELCQRVKADENFKQIPVLMLTALNDPRDVVRALEVRADSFVTKPFRGDVLLTRIRQTLANAELWRARGSNEDLEVNFAGQSYRIDADRRQIVGLLLATYENAVEQNAELDHANIELREALDTIRTLQANYRTLLESSADAIAVVSPDGITRYLNPAAKLLFDTGSGDPVGRPFPLHLSLGEVREVRFLQAAGEIVGEVRVSDTTWGPDPAFLAAIRDVTDSVRLREKLRELSITDPLTGLSNRRGFEDLVEQQIRLAKRNKATLHLLFIDLDGMKTINDTLGHDEGDRALTDTAELMRATFRGTDVLSRLGGDEFAVLAIDAGPADADLCRHRLEDRLRAFNAAESRSYQLSLSVGVVKVEQDTTQTVEELLRQADQLMYAQKVARRKARGPAIP